MRTFLILICSVALACSAGAAQNDKKSKKQARKNSQAQPTQYARPAAAPKKAAPKRYQPTSTASSYQKAKGRQGVNNQAYQSRTNANPAKKRQQQIAAAQNVQAGRYTNSAAYSKKSKQWKGNTASAAAFQSNKKYRAQRFNLGSHK